MEKEIREKVMQEIYLLDWIKIMDDAIKGRRTSWGERPIVEWRNASDEVLMALISQCKEKGIFPNTLKEAIKNIKEGLNTKSKGRKR